MLPQDFLTRPIAHRALHDKAARRPENSRAAMVAAIDRGYAIEMDLQLSADGIAMVFHDSELNRLTRAKGALNHRPARELGALKLKHSNEGIPTLAEVLDLVAGRVPLLIEIKDQDGKMGEAIGQLEEAAARALYRYEGPVALMSFNPHSVAAMADLCPGLPRGLTTSAYNPLVWAPVPRAVCERLREIPDYDRCGASFISHEASDLDRPRVAEIADAGGSVLCWTIRSARAEAAARKVAQNITFEGYLP